MTSPRAPEALTDTQWDRHVRTRLAACVADLVPGSPAVGAITLLADDVWLVHLAHGGGLIAKHQFYGLFTRDEPHDLLRVEFDALRYLRPRGGAVPVAFGIDPGAQIILLEFAGRRTLADVLVTSAPAPARRRLAGRVLRELSHIETQLGISEADWAARAVPGASVENLATSWSRVAAMAVDGLRRLWQDSRDSEPPHDLVNQVEQLCRRLGRRSPRLGVTDYQPANIVVDDDGERVTFLELSKLGWDWTERRAVQYTTSVDGSGFSLLNADVVALSPLDGGALDGHHILFQLLLVRRVLSTGSGDTAGLLRALVTPLSRDPAALEFRRGLQPLTSFRHPGLMSDSKELDK